MWFRWIVIALSLLMSTWQLIRPPEGQSGISLDNVMKNINLGLDLKGGIFMQLQVDEDDAVHQFLEEQAGIIKGRLEGENYTVVASVPDFKTFTINLTGVKAPEGKNAEELLRSDYWQVTDNGSTIKLRLRDLAIRNVKDEAVNQTVYKIQSRVDELGVTEPVINRTIGSDRIVLELAGADDSQRVHKIVREPGKLEWRLVDRNSKRDALSEAELLASLGGKVPPGKRIFPYSIPERGTTSFLLLDDVMLTARNVADVYPTIDDRGLPAVGVSLDRAGGQTMATKSQANIGQQLAIVLDGKIITAPVIQSQLGERFIIMGLDQRERDDLVIKIKSGSLPARVDILEERVIGPTLGRDAIQAGSSSALAGLLLVMVFILLYYRTAGIYALLALTMNLVIILGMLSGIGAVLTLPGIAGFILTIGMAVDANVLIFERIREELREGIMPKNAIETGYKSAFVTIMDANITTFLAAFILYLLGEGPVKGFAVMLMIGIIASIFTAVFCSRTFFLWSIQRNPSAKKLSIWPIWQSSKVSG